MRITLTAAAAAVASLALPAAASAKITLPSTAKVGAPLTITGTHLKPSSYSIVLAATNTSGSVCGTQLGRKQSVAAGGSLTSHVKIPSRLPCYQGPRGGGKHRGSEPTAPGRYFLFFGHRTGRFSFSGTRDASGKAKVLRIAG